MAMIPYLRARLLRKPVPSLAVLLCAAVLTFSLCALQASNDAAQARYEELYRTLPVGVNVTNLSGTKSDDLAIPGWVLELFNGEGLFSLDLDEYVTDLQVRLRYPIMSGPGSTLIGVSSLSIARELAQEHNGAVTWLDGYDEAVLATEEAVCIISEQVAGEMEEAELLFSYSRDPLSPPTTYSCTLKIVGTYVSDKGSTMVFCPLAVAEQVYRGLEADREIDAISARVIDNQKLPEFRKFAGYWFADPNPTGAKTEWDFAGYQYYPYALDTDDSLLRAAESTLENSLFVNGLCTWLIFGLSAGAGFFISFLMIRQRKREIALMRTMGTGQGSILLGLLAEQMILVVLGITLGGCWFRWQPMERLVFFGMVYLAGLLIALAVFLRSNLILAIKEE